MFKGLLRVQNDRNTIYTTNTKETATSISSYLEDYFLLRDLEWR